MENLIEPHYFCQDLASRPLHLLAFTALVDTLEHLIVTYGVP